MKLKKFILIGLFLLTPFSLSAVDIPLTQRLSGRILLQVESRGEAWYVNPENKQRYYLGKPNDALELMRRLGTGITNSDLKKIPIGLLDYHDTDSDHDGLPDDLEAALGTDAQNSDSDRDGFSDEEEVKNSYNPNGAGKIKIDNVFSQKNSGKIFLQVENKGEAWYIYPKNQKRYYLGKPKNALEIMRYLGLGITNNDLETLPMASASTNSQQNTTPNSQPDNSCQNCQNQNNDHSMIISRAAKAIFNQNNEEINQTFSLSSKALASYTASYLDLDGRQALFQILSNAKLASQNDESEEYTSRAYSPFTGEYVNVKFIVKKQDDGTWKMTNL